MKTFLAGTTLAVALGVGVAAAASPKYTAPINVVEGPTLKLHVSGTAPSPISETLFLAVADWDGDGVAEAGTLRVACRGNVVAFASFLPRDVGAKDAAATAKPKGFKGSLAALTFWSRQVPTANPAVVVTVQRPASDDKSLSTAGWHAATVDSGAATVCP